MMNRALTIIDNDLVLDTVDGVIRPRMSEGIEEIEQAYSLLFLTRRGEDDYFPDAGFPIDDIIGLYNQDFVVGKIRETLLQDPRTATVDDVSAELGDRHLRVVDAVAKCTLVDQQTLAASLSL